MTEISACREPRVQFANYGIRHQIKNVEDLIFSLISTPSQGIAHAAMATVKVAPL